MGLSQDLLHLLVLTAIISASGALAPGPLSFSAVAYGMRVGWVAGLWIATGHGIVEYPLILLLSTGSAYVLHSHLFTVLRYVAALVVAYFGIAIILSSGSRSSDVPVTRHPIVAGALLTGLNPFFILWWASVGVILIPEYLRLLGVLGPHALFLAHVWMDYAWLVLLAALGEGATRLLGSRGLTAIRVALGAAMIYVALGLIGLVPLL